jgi:putative DNA-binding protein
MLSLTQTQAAFARALHDPAEPIPQAIAQPVDMPPVRRFNVYRNTVYAGLTGVIAARYPAVKWLMGESLFQAAARLFVVDHPPASPVLLEYGEGFAAFLDDLEIIDDMPHLTDVARLEWLLHAARHAADTTPLDARALATVDPERTADLMFAFAPSCFLLESKHAVFSLWRSSIAEEPMIFPEPGTRGERVLVSRRGFEPEAVRLPEGAYEFTFSLMLGEPLGVAASEAFAANSAFPLDRVMALLISQETLTSYEFAQGLTENSP